MAVQAIAENAMPPARAGGILQNRAIPAATTPPDTRPIETGTLGLPAPRIQAISCNSRLSTLPVALRGSSSMNTTSRGTL
jgi:hypothetical protein